jgi:hypothetical protein
MSYLINFFIIQNIYRIVNDKFLMYMPMKIFREIWPMTSASNFLIPCNMNEYIVTCRMVHTTNKTGSSSDDWIN